MAIEKINIERFLELAKNHAVIDVRSPAEYTHAHIPGALNIPLFTDEERKIVGTTYKQQGRQAAIKTGLDFFGPKMKKMVEAVEGIGNKELGISHDAEPNSKLLIPNSGKTLLIHCWRGGMRSAGVAWLMDLYGFKTYTLAGGYKKFRNYVLDTFKHPFHLKILGGFTGSGKTEVLKQLELNGEKVIDLEEIAKHKGSAFGNIGLPPQPTQEMFENLLAQELHNKSMVNKSIGQSGNDSMTNDPMSNDLLTDIDSVWLEDESQRIGQINIPSELWKTMRHSPVYFLDIPFEERLQHLVHEYGNLDKEKMINAIERIKARLGGLETRNAINYLLEENVTDSFRTLLKYYDSWYLKGLHNREGLQTLLAKIPCEKVNPLNAKKLVLQPAYENP